jgi:hypothetical protein
MDLEENKYIIITNGTIKYEMEVEDGCISLENLKSLYPNASNLMHKDKHNRWLMYV